MWSAVDLGKGDKQVEHPRGLATNTLNGNIYIVDGDMNRIQIFHNTGDYISSIEAEGMVTPFHILLDPKYCFVSCNIRTGSIFKLEISSGNKIRALEPGLTIAGMDFDEEHNIYGCALLKQELHVFSPTHSDKIKTIRLNTNNFTEGTTHAHSIKDFLTEIIILFTYMNYPLQSFTRDGELIRTILTNEQVAGAHYFCIDPYNNFIISDFMAHQVKIFTPSGKLVVTIGKRGVAPGEFYGPSGIALALDNRIIVCDWKSEHLLQYF